jgi:diguanylate cyclase (GGDEF)-like protein
VAIFYTVFFAWIGLAAGGGPLTLGGACVAMAIAALFAARSTHTTAAAMTIVVGAAISMVPVTATLSTSSDAQLLWVALAFAAIALIPERMIVFRAAYGAAALVMLVIAEFAFRESALWGDLAADSREYIAMANRFWTVLVCACAMHVIVARSARAQRTMLGVALTEEQRANTDVLTSLANRRPVLSRFAHLDEAAVTEYTVTIVDVDAFKEINDAFGHDVGDKVIVEVAERLKEYFGPDALVSRWGGDEFIAIVEGEAAVGTVMSLERLRKTVARFPVRVADVSVPITLSIGVARSAPDSTADDVLIAADAALYAAKHAGRNRVVMSTERVGGTA